MQLQSNAKINLGLSVLRKRNDGFHELESIFIPVPWYDRILISESDMVSFYASGINIDGNIADNLCLRAYQLLVTDFSLPAVSIQLEKNIPIGAGLGGGSSNAAFVLKGLNELFELNISIEKLEEYAGKLGSDCPFFIRNQAAFVSGRGEVLEHGVNLNLSTYCLLVNPGIHISTKEAYASIVPQEPAIRIREAIQEDIKSWQAIIKNDFEQALIMNYPKLQQLRDHLFEMGALYVSMSGSGSSFFAFFDKVPEKRLFDDSYTWKGFELES